MSSSSSWLMSRPEAARARVLARPILDGLVREGEALAAWGGESCWPSSPAIDYCRDARREMLLPPAELHYLQRALHRTAGALAPRELSQRRRSTALTDAIFQLAARMGVVASIRTFLCAHNGWRRSKVQKGQHRPCSIALCPPDDTNLKHCARNLARRAATSTAGRPAPPGRASRSFHTHRGALQLQSAGTELGSAVTLLKSCRQATGRDIDRWGRRAPQVCGLTPRHHARHHSATDARGRWRREERDGGAHGFSTQGGTHALRAALDQGRGQGKRGDAQAPRRTSHRTSSSAPQNAISHARRKCVGTDLWLLLLLLLLLLFLHSEKDSPGE